MTDLISIPDQLNVTMAELLGMQPCDKWYLQRYTEFGGIWFKDGACEHLGEDGCYPRNSIPQFCNSVDLTLSAAKRLGVPSIIIEFTDDYKRADKVVIGFGGNIQTVLVEPVSDGLSSKPLALALTKGIIGWANNRLIGSNDARKA